MKAYLSFVIEYTTDAQLPLEIYNIFNIYGKKQY